LAFTFTVSLQSLRSQDSTTRPVAARTAARTLRVRESWCEER
jgi:hypothetical protein